MGTVLLRASPAPFIISAASSTVRWVPMSWAILWATSPTNCGPAGLAGSYFRSSSALASAFSMDVLPSAWALARYPPAWVGLASRESV